MNIEDTSIAYKSTIPSAFLSYSCPSRRLRSRQNPHYQTVTPSIFQHPTRFVTKLLPKTPHSTIGVEFATKIIQLANGVKVKAQIWDTGTLLSLK
jgi:GTPase SAR1 family protein